MATQFSFACIVSFSMLTFSAVTAHAQAAPAAVGGARAPETPADTGPAPGATAPVAPAPGDVTGTAAPADSVAAAPSPAAPLVTNANAAPAKGDRTLVADAEEGGSPIERPGQTYYFVGARYRGIIVPKFMMNIFANGGDTVYVHAFGPEFAIRKNDFEYNIGLWYAAYSMDPTLFKGKSDGEAAWEIVSSRIKVLYLTSDFLWSHEFTPEVALNYGLGAGLGLVFGDLHRQEAYKDANGKYVPCRGPEDPPQASNVGGIDYCAKDGTHYGNYTEPSWAHHGSKPFVFPWLVFQTGLRFKPHRNVVGRLDVGFGTSGFFLGAGADYGI